MRKRKTVGPEAPGGGRTRLSRRRFVDLAGAAAICAIAPGSARTQAGARPLTLGLTPVFLSNDVELLSAMQNYLGAALGGPVKLAQRRTYEEITTLLVSGQLDAAWICGYPYVAFRDRLGLVAAPVWRGRPLYQSYVIGRADAGLETFDALRGRVHAFSDPNSNSGYLVTAALLASRGERPERYFSRAFFTYAHRNVVRAVASGLADSGSVDGYIWEVMSQTEPELTGRTRIVRRSEWLGFPPIAAPIEIMQSSRIEALRRALIGMADDAGGRVVLDHLRLDGFDRVSHTLYEPIAAKSDLVKRFG